MRWILSRIVFVFLILIIKYNGRLKWSYHEPPPHLLFFIVLFFIENHYYIRNCGLSSETMDEIKSRYWHSTITAGSIHNNALETVANGNKMTKTYADIVWYKSSIQIEMKIKMSIYIFFAKNTIDLLLSEFSFFIGYCWKPRKSRFFGPWVFLFRKKKYCS